MNPRESALQARIDTVYAQMQAEHLVSKWAPLQREHMRLRGLLEPEAVERREQEKLERVTQEIMQ